jgi:hypothetical protein
MTRREKVNAVISRRKTFFIGLIKEISERDSDFLQQNFELDTLPQGPLMSPQS